ncbi:Nuclear receptor 2C2-associated protein [Dimargaris xerosporica]|nr:Nuclear receptor 2C2-associated protein [Dimargaris xerosporica]
MSSLLGEIAALRVSSVLNKDVRNFGKQFLTDGSEETCWNSEQGTPQSIAMVFARPVHVEQLQLMFQGGFVGKNCQVWVVPHDGDGRQLRWFDFYPEDVNTLQISFQTLFTKPISYPFFIYHGLGGNRENSDLASDACPLIDRLKLVFPESTDFFGRVTVYQLDILGQPA